MTFDLTTLVFLAALPSHIDHDQVLELGTVRFLRTGFLPADHIDAWAAPAVVYDSLQSWL